MRRKQGRYGRNAVLTPKAGTQAIMAMAGNSNWEESLVPDHLAMETSKCFSGLEKTSQSGMQRSRQRKPVLPEPPKLTA
jgi:hypothetical protein